MALQNLFKIVTASAILSGSVFVASRAHAEYRAYDLRIEDSTSGQKRSVITTLDDMQYAEYYPVRSTEFVVIADTWLCRQRTDVSQDPLQRICPNPGSRSK